MTLLRVFVVASLAAAVSQVAGERSPTIVLDPGTKYQTITGWEAMSHGGQMMPNRQLVQPTLLDRAANDLGINRVRLEIRSGSEHMRDTTAEWQAGLLTNLQLQQVWYTTVNDNDDADVIDWNGFHFTELDLKIDQLVNPLRALLEARGEELFVNLTYVSFTPNNDLHRKAEEYAEFVLATYLHIQQKYGWVPDTWEVMLEPDNVKNWTGERVGRSIVAAAKRLQAAGFAPRFIAPSTANIRRALTFIDELMSVRGARQHVSELSYHRYGAFTDEHLRMIAEKGRRFGVATAMLEHIGSGYEHLHHDLTVAQVSAWEQFVLAPQRPGPGDNGAQLYMLDDRDPENPRVVMARRTKFLRQYFKFIRHGAVRIGATSADPAFDPVAFVHPDGGTVVVVKAEGGGAFTVGGLPGATYGVKYTTSAEYDVDLPDIPLASGAALAAAIPAKGVLTIYRR